MSRALFWIHIGLHKTGTTFLQRVFEANRSWLAEFGLLFPRTGLVSPQNPASFGATRGHAGFLKAALRPSKQKPRQLLEALLEEANSIQARQVLLSSEIFSAPGNEAAAQGFAAALPSDAEKRVIVYLRRQDFWVESFYREVLGWAARRETRTLDRFVEEEGGRWFDYEARLSPWVEAFGRENVMVRSYDDARSGSGLLSDFCSVLGLAETPRDTSGYATVNPSLDPGLVQFFRAVNAHAELSDEKKAAFTRGFLATAEANSESNKDALRATLIDDRLWDIIARDCRERNRRVCRELVTGPCEALVFPDRRPASTLVQTKLTYEQASTAVRLLSRRDEAAESTCERRGAFGTITTLKQPLAETRLFVSYHLNIGANRIVLFFDDPEDPGVAEYQGHPRVICIPCTPEHWIKHLGRPPEKMAEKQHTNIRVGHEILKAEDVEWAISIDSDELLYSTGSVTSQLAKVDTGAELAKVWPAEAIIHESMPGTGSYRSRYFKLRPGDRETRQAAARAYEHLSNWTKHGFFGHLQGKQFWRVTTEIDIYRQHNPRHSTRNLKRVVLDDMKILHFDCASFDVWYQKWYRRNLGQTRALNIGEERARQQKTILEVMRMGDKEAVQKLYESWFAMDNDQIKNLEDNGLVMRVDIPHALFDEPK